jgi:hypothetical protein
VGGRADFRAGLPPTDAAYRHRLAPTGVTFAPLRAISGGVQKSRVMRSRTGPARWALGKPQGCGHGRGPQLPDQPRRFLDLGMWDPTPPGGNAGNSCKLRDFCLGCLRTVLHDQPADAAYFSDPRKIRGAIANKQRSEPLS